MSVFGKKKFFGSSFLKNRINLYMFYKKMTVPYLERAVYPYFIYFVLIILYYKGAIERRGWSWLNTHC